MDGKSRVSAGNASEILFDYHVTVRGFEVSVPISGTSVYDRIVDNGIDLFKVQIKSTSVKNNKGNYFIKLYKSKAKSKTYQRKEIDFFAVHIHETGNYYILPFHKAGNTITIVPGVKGKYDEFLNRWDLFDARK